MRRLAILAALGCAAPGAAQAPAGQVACVASAEGANGEFVTVFIHVEPDGQRPASYASWTPPLITSSGAGGLDQPDASLLIGYDDVSKGGLGKRAEAASVLVEAFSPPRARIPSARLQDRLAKLTGEARFDSGAPVRFGFNQPGPAHRDLPGTAFRTAELVLPAVLPTELELRLLDRNGKPVLTQRYAAGGAASRDALFAKAWDEADTAAANPARCEPVSSGPNSYAGASPG